MTTITARPSFGFQRLAIAAAVSLPLAVTVSAQAQIPTKMEFARYQGMLDKSPFAVATAATPPPPTANFAKDLYIANAAHGPDGDLVTLASSADKNFKICLPPNTPSDGFSISNIEWSDKVGATKVTIAKDGQFATLTFNQALLTQPIANAPSGAQPQPAQVPTLQQNTSVPGAAMGAANPPGGGIKPAPIPMLPTPPPHVRPTIPRNPVATPAPQAQ